MIFINIFSPSNHKFQNALENNLRKWLDIVLSCYDNNYEAVNKDMNQTIDDPKGHLWYEGRYKSYTKVKYLPEPEREGDY